LDTKRSVTDVEAEVIASWKREGTFQAARERRKDGKRFLFVEGPPTANGKPHIGHAMTRAVKDIYLRYRSLCGYNVTPYVGGWDCHGLPVELEVEKKLNMSSKQDIVSYGMAKFNKACRESVFTYLDVWLEMSERIGFWLDYEGAYITMTDPYIESVWWSLKRLHDEGMLEKGHYVVPYCPRCGTPLSSHEVAQGYKQVKDPSISVLFKFVDRDEHILAWTTTPWTLISNVVLAIKGELPYVLVEHKDKRIWLAKDALGRNLPDAKVVREAQGSELLDLDYEPLFPFVRPDTRAYFVTEADFVTTDEGTGVVHCAPAYGLDDYELCAARGVGLVNPVDEAGRFREEVTDYAGQFVKDADEAIIRDLLERGQIVKWGKTEHTYPFCWRCDSPLLYYALESWFVRMSRIKDRMKAANAQINWHPGHLRDGRFGNFLDELKDWALSRNRFWGTPLPVWRCGCGKEVCMGSRDELESMHGGPLPQGFELHRPWVDDLPIACPDCSGSMVREQYVIDCWYDSGSAVFAQFNHPHSGEKHPDELYPVDFISEALDQTRGWFYTLLALSVLMYDRPAYKNVVCLGLILDEEGKKMSKSKGNAVDAMEVMDNVGADAVRFYFASHPLWNSVLFGEELVREAKRKTLDMLMNVQSFFFMNASLDSFEPTGNRSPVPLDRWIISRIQTTIVEVRKGLDGYELHKATRAISGFIDQLSNWWLRRSRRRFYEEGTSEDKGHAYETLFESLVTLTRLMAPITPFSSDAIHRRLIPDGESVHLGEFPLPDDGATDMELEKEMDMVLTVAESGRRLRQENNIKLRQPLSSLTVVGKEGDTRRLEAYLPVLGEELNVKDVRISSERSELIQVQIVPNFKKLGPRFKGNMKQVADAITEADPTTLSTSIAASGTCSVQVDGNEVILSSEEILVQEKGLEGASHADAGPFLISMDTTITDDLRLEGFAREVIRRIQTTRKDLDMAYDQRITVGYVAEGELKTTMERFGDHIAAETLATTLTDRIGDGALEFIIEGIRIHLDVSPV